MFVRSWMSPPGIALAPEMPVPEALALMDQRGAPHGAVAENGRFIGLVLRSDLHRTIATSDRVLADGVGSVVRPLLRWATPEDPIDHAVQLMILNELTVLPVLRGERLVGVLRPADVYQAFAYVMGVAAGGARIIVRASTPDALLEEVHHRSAGLIVRSLAFCSSPGGESEGVMRVRGRAGISAA